MLSGVVYAVPWSVRAFLLRVIIVSCRSQEVSLRQNEKFNVILGSVETLINFQEIKIR